MLRDDPHRGDAECWQVLDIVIGQDHPSRALDHVGKFFSEKVLVLEGRLMGATGHGLLLSTGRPGRGLKDDRAAALLEAFQEGLGRV
eukprot:scaffold6530_cov103-Cylindrotheca_fusiformis.AAC.1